MASIQKYLLLVSLVVLLLPTRLVMASQNPINDVRIVIDVSGSMKKNDPQNLRSPAVRMLMGLLPEGDMAGVWTFAKYVNMLVPYREVNEAWRMEADKQADEIHSYGLFTNIEQALNKATANQKTPDPRYRRSIILLSDGLVDVSTDPEISKASKQRILDTIVPRLKKAKVAVHTIALADTSDHALLRSISLATDGWYEQVDTAEELQRVFLHLFEKSAQRDTVPLTDNHFKIDASVNEMTLLVFRRPTSKPTELLLPNQSRINQQNHPRDVRWHSENGYDLVTIDNPQSGAWFIDADLDPDNRVMVITDLKLATTDLPNNTLIGESFDIEASLTDKGEVIIRQDFLKFVDAHLREESEIADPIEQDLNVNQQKGIFRTHVGDTFQPGRNDVVITMKSPTFERQRRQSINVVATPFEITVDKLDEPSTRSHRITIKPDQSLIKSDNLVIAAMLTAEDGSEWSYDVMKLNEHEWQLTLADLQPQEQYKVALQIRGETLKGRGLFIQPQPIILPAEMAPVEMQQEPTPQPVMDEMAVTQDDVLPSLEDSLIPTLVTDSSTDSGSGMSSLVKLAIGNTLFLILGLMGIFIWRRNAAAVNPGELL